jgi:NAD-dependent dihydropyrimidine dehydrogenase PreA subunit
MTYVITQLCTRESDCVDVCPVDCIHPTKDEDVYESCEMLSVDPEECIDCGACEPACPVTAIFAEEDVPDAPDQQAKGRKACGREDLVPGARVTHPEWGAGTVLGVDANWMKSGPAVHVRFDDGRGAFMRPFEAKNLTVDESAIPTPETPATEPLSAPEEELLHPLTAFGPRPTTAVEPAATPVEAAPAKVKWDPTNLEGVLDFATTQAKNASQRRYVLPGKKGTFSVSKTRPTSNTEFHVIQSNGQVTQHAIDGSESVVRGAGAVAVAPAPAAVTPPPVKAPKQEAAVAGVEAEPEETGESEPPRVKVSLYPMEGMKPSIKGFDGNIGPTESAYITDGRIQIGRAHV